VCCSPEGVVLALNRARHALHLQTIDDCQSALGSQCAVVKAESRECVVHLHTQHLLRRGVCGIHLQGLCQRRGSSTEDPVLPDVEVGESAIHLQAHSRLASMRRNTATCKHSAKAKAPSVSKELSLMSRVVRVRFACTQHTTAASTTLADG
jgi:hypothetical protein